MNSLPLNKYLKNIILSTVIVIALIMPAFYILADVVAVPQNINEAKEKGIAVVTQLLQQIPQQVTVIWKNEVLPIWSNMWQRGESFYVQYAAPTIKNMLQKAQSIAGQEIKKREPVVRDEFNKETQEMQKDIPIVSKGIWDRFMELIK